MNSLQQQLAKCGLFGRQRIITGNPTAYEYAKRCSISTYSSSEHSEASHQAKSVRPEFVPLFAMVSLALGLGLVTMYREMVHSPTVLVSKKARETVSELDDPGRAHKLGEAFVEESPLRKVAALKADIQNKPH